MLKHHEFSLADVSIPHLIRLGKDIEKLEPHDLLTVIEYRSKIKEKKQIENKENSLENEVVPVSDVVSTSEKEIVIEESKEVIEDDSNFYFFSSKKHCFHPTYPALFVFRDKTFISVSQLLAYSKAVMSEDDVSAFKILDLNNHNMLAKSIVEGNNTGYDIIKDAELYQRWKELSHEINEINKDIKNVNAMVWEEKRMGIMTVGVREKVNQNEDIQKVLTSTKDKTIVFAIQDGILGCGIKEKDITQDSTWCGVNELGKILTSLK